jgi:cell division protein FtsZ
VNDVPQSVVVVAAIVLGGVLALRLLVLVPDRIRRNRHPEGRAIRVIGVGGGGSNAVDHMVAARLPGVSFVACNTDAQALRRSRAGSKIRIGEAVTRGLGSGGDPEVGRRAAEEDESEIARTVARTDLVFVIACLGGGTGSGAAPIIGASAKVQDALVIAVVTKPFAFEGVQRQRIADAAAAELASNVDAIITIPNDRVGNVVAEDASILDAFELVDDVILQAVEGIIDVLSGPGLINLDFADVQAVMQHAGPALIGLGRGNGQDRAVDAARQAVASPLLEASIRDARQILFNVSGPPDLRLREVRQAADEIRASADPDANVIFGASLSRPAGDDVQITLIATGLDWPKADDVSPMQARPKASPIPPRPVPIERSEPTFGEVEIDPPSNGARKRPPKRAALAEADVEAASAEPTESEPAGRTEREPTETEPTLNEPPPAKTLTEPPPAKPPTTTPATAPPRRDRPAASTTLDELDLEVPSFLRRRRPPTAPD